MKSTDPMEQLIESALIAAGEPYVHNCFATNLDFYLPDRDIYIEVKRMHSNRISDQMKRAPNIIVAQGKPAVQMLALLLINLQRSV